MRSETMHIRIKAGAIVIAMSTVASFLIGTLNYGISLDGYGLNNFLTNFPIMFFAFYAVFYYGNLEAHKGSIERDGDKYLLTLSKKINDHGLTRLILKRWIIKYFDQKGEYSKDKPNPNEDS